MSLPRVSESHPILDRYRVPEDPAEDDDFDNIEEEEHYELGEEDYDPGEEDYDPGEHDYDSEEDYDPIEDYPEGEETENTTSTDTGGSSSLAGGSRGCDSGSPDINSLVGDSCSPGDSDSAYYVSTIYSSENSATPDSVVQNRDKEGPTGESTGATNRIPRLVVCDELKSQRYSRRKG